MVRHIRQEFGDCFTVCVAGENKMIVFFLNCAKCSCRKFQQFISPTKEIFCTCMIHPSHPNHPPTLGCVIKLHMFLYFFLVLQYPPPLRKFQSLLSGGREGAYAYCLELQSANVMGSLLVYLCQKPMELVSSKVTT